MRIQGYASDTEIFGTIDLWWVVYAIEGVLTLVVTILMFCSPESPSFLMTQGKREEAEKCIIFYHGVTEAEAQPLLDGMKSSGGGDRPIGLFEIFTNKTWLCGFLVGNGVMAGAILCGVAAVNAFAFEILMNVGLNPLQASLGNMVICIMAVIGVLTSGRLVESWGRRPLLIYTFGGLTIINTLISALMLWFEKSPITFIGWCVVVSICCFNLLFAAGPGPLCLFVGGELANAAMQDLPGLCGGRKKGAGDIQEHSKSHRSGKDGPSLEAQFSSRSADTK
ncbi:hypothetical protein ANCCEY_03802 [Ancylostoma ceylanicum]|uniref:Major facilitator superfamily (MFS) profile domain-containing protein n=1 Tax=Ancylostoma ceylanicum TaxID=53326 RepID=A0A0D6M3Z3_9BILA|nr:hypothetical protein ANCCEY_03802 [Ancylostoma ceylanicum]